MSEIFTILTAVVYAILVATGGYLKQKYSEDPEAFKISKVVETVLYGLVISIITLYVDLPWVANEELAIWALPMIMTYFKALIRAGRQLLS